MNPKITKAYRIFFGLKNQDGTYSIKSVTEDGGREYQAVGYRKGFTTIQRSPRSAKPRSKRLRRSRSHFTRQVTFSCGRMEIGSFQYAVYERDHWAESIKLSYPGISGGTLTPTPNGLGLIHWVPGSAGVTLFSLHGRKRDLLAAEYSFLSTPSSVPDGKGIVGLIKKDNRTVLAYVPVEMPLADVANAWMFAEEQGDQDLFSRKGGLLRDLPNTTSSTPCTNRKHTIAANTIDPLPHRPYLVTTDIFWELLAAAYEGIFIVKERQAGHTRFLGLRR